MHNKKLLYITAVSTVPSHKGEEKIKKAVEQISKRNGNPDAVYRDESGRSREDWEDIMGGKVPNGFSEAEKEFYGDTQVTEDGNIFLQPEELEYEFIDLVLPKASIDFIIDHEEIGSLIYTKAGNVVHVEENCEELFYYIGLLEMSWFDRIKNSVLAFFARFKKQKTFLDD
jgi:hypothetical protein